MSDHSKVDVISIVAEILELDVKLVTPESSIFNLARWDSLAHMRIISAIEDALGKSMSIDDIASAFSVSHLMEIVVRYEQ